MSPRPLTPARRTRSPGHRGSLLHLAGAALVILLVSLLLARFAPTMQARLSLLTISTAARNAALLLAGLHLNTLAAASMRQYRGSVATPISTAAASGFLTAQMFPTTGDTALCAATAVMALSLLTLFALSRRHWRSQAHSLSGLERLDPAGSYTKSITARTYHGHGG